MPRSAPTGRRAAAAAAAVAVVVAAAPVQAEDASPYPYAGMVEIDTPHDFDTLWDRMEQAVLDHDMLLVGRASASRAAAGRGIEIAGNGIVEVYRNDFAVRMLGASVPAGFEAPIRYYLTEDADGTTTLTYRRPSAIFAPYGSDDLDAMAEELDAIFAAIAEQASAPE